jgi:hypothetical protein
VTAMAVGRVASPKQALVVLAIVWLIMSVLIGYALHLLYGPPLWFAITLMLTSGVAAASASVVSVGAGSRQRNRNDGAA